MERIYDFCELEENSTRVVEECIRVEDKEERE
jgi:hypothetical protein